MKKRIVALLLVMLMLFASACSKDEPVTDEPVTDDVSTTAAADTSYSGFQLDELPDIGEFKLKKEVEYFYSQPLAEYQPNEAYEEVVPYLAAVKTFVDSMMNDPADIASGSDENLYGIATSDGKIITSAVYSTFSTYTSFDGKTNVYVGEKLNTTSTFITNDESTEEQQTKTLDIISSDGKNFCSVENVVNCYGFSTNASFDSVLFEKADCIDVYSMDCEKLFEVRGIDCSFFETGIPHVAKTDTGYSFFAIDYNGENYVYCMNYDFDGNLISQSSIDAESTSEVNSVAAVVETDSYKDVLYNISADKITTQEFDDIQYCAERDVFVCIDKDALQILEIDGNGKVLNNVKLPQDTEDMDEWEVGGAILLKNEDDVAFAVYSLKSGEIINLDDAVSVYGVWTCGVWTANMGSGTYYLCVCGKDGITKVYDGDGKLIDSVKCKNKIETGAGVEYEPSGVIYCDENCLVYIDEAGEYKVKVHGGEAFTASVRDGYERYDVSGIAGNYVLFYDYAPNDDYVYSVFDAEKGEYVTEEAYDGEMNYTPYGNYIFYCDGDGVIHNIDENGKDIIKITNKEDLV